MMTTNRELNLTQLNAIAGATWLTTNPVQAQEEMFARGRLFTPDELKMYYGRIMEQRSNRQAGFQPDFSL